MRFDVYDLVFGGEDLARQVVAAVCEVEAAVAAAIHPGDVAAQAEHMAEVHLGLLASLTPEESGERDG